MRGSASDRGIAAGVSQRAVYIVDPQNVIRFVMVTDLSVGRNTAEVLRVLDALQTDELCPCNWKKGEATLQPAQERRPCTKPRVCARAWATRRATSN